ncbi:MAG: hypothetical protein HYU64_13685 [Armatimonadetes bacterium]|nr:hypothetical protein [Armatimonadota bacterium]
MATIGQVLAPIIPRNIADAAPVGEVTPPVVNTPATDASETPATPEPSTEPAKPEHYKVKGKDYVYASVAAGTLLGGLGGFAKGYFDTRNADFVQSTRTVDFNEQYLYGHKRDAYENETQVVNGQKVVNSYRQEYHPDIRERKAGSYEVTEYKKPDGVWSPLNGALIGMGAGLATGIVVGTILYLIKDNAD